MDRGLTAQAKNSQARVEEAALSLYDGCQFARIQPYTLATRADVDLHGVAYLRGQFLTAFRAVHPMRLLQPVLFGFRLCLLLLSQLGHSLLHFVHPDVFFFAFSIFHNSSCFCLLTVLCRLSGLHGKPLSSFGQNRRIGKNDSLAWISTEKS